MHCIVVACCSEAADAPSTHTVAYSVTKPLNHLFQLKTENVEYSADLMGAAFLTVDMKTSHIFTVWKVIKMLISNSDISFREDKVNAPGPGFSFTI